MPVRRVSGGYKCGSVGKVYRKRASADRQCRAIYASKGKKRMNRSRKA